MIWVEQMNGTSGGKHVNSVFPEGRCEGGVLQRNTSEAVTAEAAAFESRRSRQFLVAPTVAANPNEMF
jgi:hypothetical protein